MKRTVLAAVLAVSSICSFAQNQDNGRRERLEGHVYTLAADSMNGRKAGSSDAARARDYIVKEFTEMGLNPLFLNGYEYQFQKGGVTYTDVAGIIWGNELSDEYIIVGAHYDHLGVNAQGAVYNGADDNASGTAAIIEVARELLARQDELKRNVIIVAFDAEEVGLYGSNALCALLNDEGILNKVKLMMSIDMVGWYGKSHYLKLEGVGTIASGKKIVRELATADDINLKLKRFETSILTATDTEAFAESGIPTLAITTGMKSPYHKPGDDPELIDYEGLDKVTDYIADFTGLVAADTDFSASGRVADKHRASAKLFDAGITAYLGATNMSLYKSGLTTSGATAYGVGVSGQFNFKMLGVRADAIYSRNMAYLPDPANIYESKLPFRFSAINVPVQFLVQSTKNSRVYLGAGAYYSYIIDNDGLSYDFNRHTFGGVLSLGAKVGHFGVSMNAFFQGNDLFTDPTVPAQPITTFVAASYYF